MSGQRAVVKNGVMEFISSEEFAREEKIQAALKELDPGHRPRPKHQNGPVEDTENVVGPSLMVEVEMADDQVDAEGKLVPNRGGSNSSVFEQRAGMRDAAAPRVYKSSPPGDSVIRGERRPAR
jgi:hypothetical protein